ncbi:MAG: DNA primase [Syntrophales bacterium]|nr:DNA primase [Syntrophales bacterium]MDY0043385.1 DNA primase [Syntrophales bacterium]
MNWHIPHETIEEIKRRTNIVDLVSEFVTLKKAGRNFTGLCPFHSEKTPSFSVNPEKQIYRCFGCGEGGDIFTFLMKVNNSSFPEAVQYLAVKAGIEIPKLKKTDDAAKDDNDREKLIKVNRIAAGFFSKNYFAEKGRPARDYIAARGMQTGIAEIFQLGYALPGWRNLKNYLSAAKVPDKYAQSAGLIIKSDSGFYDRFRGRLIFPIENISGEIVAFGGRDLGNGEPKYLNSPESPIYVKGDNLYGLYRTKNEVRKNDYLVIVEGYFDLISLWNAGIKNVAASLGTALTRRQAELIRRFTRNVVIIFDGDEAGRGAIERSLSIFLDIGMHVRVVKLPEGLDPDDYVKKFGKEALDAIIVSAPSAVDYYLESVMGEGRSLEDKVENAKSAILFIGAISDVIQRNLFIKRTAEKFGLDEALIKSEVIKSAAKRRTSPDNSYSNRKKKGDTLDPVELYLIYLMIEFPHTIPYASDNSVLDFFKDLRLKKTGEMLFEAYANRRELRISDIAIKIADTIVRDCLLEMAMNESPGSRDEITDKVFFDAISKIKSRWYKERHKSLGYQMKEARAAGDIQLLNRLLIEKKRMLGEERNLQSVEKKNAGRR